MKSFFSRIQNKFDASYGGRYVETILLEITREDDVIAKVLGQTNKKCYIQTEYQFTVNDRKRIADIAVFDLENDEIIALAELKYDDHLSPKNNAQLADYIDFCRDNNCKFTYLTQYYPPNSDCKIVLDAGFKHYLFSHLASIPKIKEQSQISSLFIGYLQDKGLCMKEVNNDDLYKLLVRLFNPTSGQSKIQNNKSMIEGIPDSLQSLMNNISVLSQEIARFIDSKRAPAIDFRVWPYFKFSKKQLREMLEDDESHYVSFLGENDKYGGEVYIFAKSVIIDTKKVKDDWLYIEYGYKVSIDKGDKDFSTSLYAQVYGKQFSKEKIEIFKDKTIANSTLSKKDKCIKHISGLISEATKLALQHTKDENYTHALSTLDENSANFIQSG